MALGTNEKYWAGSVVADDYGRLIVVGEGDEVGPLESGEKYWAGSNVTDEYGRLVVVGIEGGGGAASMGTVYHGEEADAERPTGYAAITWIGSVEPENATEHDIWIEA